MCRVNIIDEIVQALHPSNGGSSGILGVLSSSAASGFPSSRLMMVGEVLGSSVHLISIFTSHYERYYLY